MPDKAKLSLEEEKLIRSYLIKLIVLPGAILSVLSFAVGFFVQDVARGTAYRDAYSEAIGVTIANISEAVADVQRHAETAAKVTKILEETEKLYDSVMTSKIVTSTEHQIKAVADNLVTRKDFLERVQSVGIKECRICFRESEGSSQCQGARNSCSGWSRPGQIGAWSKSFRDDTDNRGGGCRYQWRLECK